MTPEERRLIDAAKVRAACNDRYNEAQDKVAANMHTDDDIFERALAASSKAYQAVVDEEFDDGQSGAFQAARMKRDCAQEACKLAESEYQLALQALTEKPA